jgi:SnoaL-like domain
MRRDALVHAGIQAHTWPVPDTDPLVTAYLRGLTERDSQAVLALFAPDGAVHSPLYGRRPATDFFPALFADTAAADLTLLATLHGRTVDGTPTVAFWFRFDWRLASGTEVPFEVVDVAELDAAGRITVLHIVYDTAGVRPAFQAASTRPAG